MMMSKPNITMEITKLDRNNKSDNSIKYNNIIEPFEGIYKKNSRIIFFILLILVAIIYWSSN
jgi:hypothetical protein